MFGDNAFLVEQLGFGHTSIAQSSSCTIGVMINYLVNTTVRVSFLLYAYYTFYDADRFPGFQLPQGRSTECAVDDTDLFPALSGTTTTSKRSNLVRRWWR